jgi:N utilization substance protein B
LYEVDVLGLDNQMTAEELLEHNHRFFKNITQTENDFILKIVQKVLNSRENIDKVISQNLIGWKLERLLPVDRSLLRMGLAESYVNRQKAIIIDDIIRIAKKYGGEDSYKIINAVLDKVIK